MVGDDPAQERRARAELAQADLVALGSAAMCEVVWVLNARYHRSASEIAAAIRNLVEADNVVTDRQAIEAGLAMLEAGGDFADGVIAYEGAWLGGDTFVSFDRRAVSQLQAAGRSARAPA